MLCAVNEVFDGAYPFLGTGVTYIRWFIGSTAVLAHIFFTMRAAIPFVAGDAGSGTSLISAKMSFPLTLPGFPAVISHKVTAGYVKPILSDLSGNCRRMSAKIFCDLTEWMPHTKTDFNGEPIG